MFCNNIEVFGEFLVKDNNFVSFHFTAFLNKVLFLGFAFISFLSSLSSFSPFPGCQTHLLRMTTQEMLG